MKRLIGWILACQLLACPGLQAGEMERILQKGEMVVSFNRGTPPFCMEVNGELTGLDVDLARLLAAALGVKLKALLPESFEEHIPRLLSGEADIVIAAMTRTPERGLRVNFSDPYFEVSQAALVRRDKVRKDAQSYFELADVKGLRVGVKRSTTMEAFAWELFPRDAITLYPSHFEAVEALLKGEVDATVHDSPFVRVWTRANPEHADGIKALLAPTTREGYGFAVRKGDPDFVQWLNLFLSQARNDGTMELLTFRYFVEMPWLAAVPTKEVSITRAQLLRNRFLAEKMEALERSRREGMRAAGAPF